MSLRPFRLGASTMLVDDSGGPIAVDPLPGPRPMPYTPPGPVEFGPRPVADGPFPCAMANRMVPPGGAQPMLWCNPDGSPFIVASATPAIASVPTSDGRTPVSNPGAPAAAGATVIVSPTSGAIPPPNTPIVAAPTTNFLTSSLFGGIPNWMLLGVAALFLMGGKK